MAVVRKKQDDKALKALRELVTVGGGNRQCFDCGQKGPTYVNMTIGSFVCTRCSGVLRGLTPPHRVKSISMATFTQEEIDFLKAHGNDLCAKTWLGLWDPKRAVHQDHRELMIDKYERKRYYLEPASPLKSLTNAASLKATSAAATTTTNTTAPTQQNGTTHQQPNTLTNGYGNYNNNNKQSIQLTPPTSQRTSANGLHKAQTSSSAISRPHHQQNGFHHHQQQQQPKQQDAFMVNISPPGINGLKSNSVSSAASTGALSDTSSCASNGFGPEADFVADFGSANIFDATSAGSVGSPAVSSASSVASSNGYAKIQPIRTAHQQQQQQQHQFMNGHAGSVAAKQNGATSENFADFDHAPIFNAAGLPVPNGVNNNKTATANAFNNNNNNNNKLPGEDRYAALKDLDEQLRESKAVAAAAASIVSSAVVDSFGNVNVHNNNVNPFKSQQQQQQVNPFQATNNNSSSSNNNNSTTQNLYGQLTVIPNGAAAAAATTTNGFTNHHQQQQQQPLGYFNYSNGFASGTPSSASATMFPAGPNGCGFGFGTMQQQLAATGGGMGMAMGGGAFNNPFAATGASNSNNPFL